MSKSKEQLQEEYAREAFKRANTTIEELDEAYKGAQPAPAGVPTHFEDPGRKVRMRSKDTRVVAPNRQQLEVYGSQQVPMTCGQCEHFDLEGGRKQIIEERFAERLVREENWKLRHLGAPVDALGVCAENRELAVTYVSGARNCPSFRPKKR